MHTTKIRDVRFKRHGIQFNIRYRLSAIRSVIRYVKGSMLHIKSKNQQTWHKSKDDWFTEDLSCLEDSINKDRSHAFSLFQTIKNKRLGII
ncbi:hypothetical protein CEXT_189721 [Caerostris extrusa]|uniref:Uncharacterized protein n=1 Tax=Caerostris extrusa TaxID=172846 RepID=A0AAV4XY87_CAEEX|nr:hypothetical protein CEXT_189721 [Caerostris extrusa]